MWRAVKPGMAASLAIHLAVLLIAAWALAPSFDEAETLIVEYSGAEANEQSEAASREQAGGSPSSRADMLQPRSTTQAEENLPSDTATPSLPATEQRPATPAKAAPASPGPSEVAGTDQRQEARRIRPRPESEPDPLREYAKLLTKKVMSRLVYPEAGRRAGLRGDAAVTFTIGPDGALRPDSLRVVSSSGEAKLDESALQTIRASAPFDPPQREITLKITVKYGP